MIFLAGCAERAIEPDENPDGIPLDVLQQKMYDTADKIWNDFLAQNPSNNRTECEDIHLSCDCWYVIEDVEFEPNPAFPEFGVELAVQQTCDPLNPFTCGVFSGYYFSSTICASCNVPGCCDEWSEMPPLDIFPFNCGLPACSTFPIFGGAYWYNPQNCQGDLFSSWSITFNILCAESSPNPNCGPGSGYGYNSGPITISSEDENPIVFIQLQDCGCVPTLIP